MATMRCSVFVRRLTADGRRSVAAASRRCMSPAVQVIAGSDHDLPRPFLQTAGAKQPPPPPLTSNPPHGPKSSQPATGRQRPGRPGPPPLPASGHPAHRTSPGHRPKRSRPTPPPPPHAAAPSEQQQHEQPQQPQQQQSPRPPEVPAQPPQPPPPPGPAPAPPPDRTLTEQLESLEAFLQPTSEQFAQKDWVVSTMKPLFEKHTGGTFNMFGSCENGFWMNGSDVDACLMIRQCTQRQSWITKLKLVQCLVESEKWGRVEVVRGARVPVAKVFSNQGDGDLCDISINNVAAVANTRFVRTFADIDPRVSSMGRLIKHWASRRCINNRSEGTLSTYTLILKLFYYLQTCSNPLLPRAIDILSKDTQKARLLYASELAGQASGRSVPLERIPPELEAQLPRCMDAYLTAPELDDKLGVMRPLPFLTEREDILARCPNLADSSDSEDLGALLEGFFKLWGDEEFAGSRTVYVYDATREANDHGVLVMCCPLTGKNVNPFTPTTWRAIHSEFARAADMLASGRRFAEVCEPAKGPPMRRARRMRK